MTSQTRSQAVRQSLHLHIGSSSSQSKVSVVPHLRNTSSATQSIKADKASPPSSPQMPDSVMFSVLCFYDFVGNEPDLLSFSKGEILDIVKRDQTGWWAAMPKGGKVVGWIPQAFVKPLGDEMAEKLRNLDKKFRIPEFEAEELYNISTYESGSHIFDSDSTTPSPTFEDFKSNSTSTLATSHHSKDSSPQIHVKSSLSSLPSASAEPLRPRRHPRPPPSPSTPMPLPPAAISRSISLDKPTPLTPPPDAEKQPTAQTTRSCSLSYRGSRRHLGSSVDHSIQIHLSTEIGPKNFKNNDRIASPDPSGSSKANGTMKLQRKTSKCKSPQKPITNQAFYLRPTYSDQIMEDEKGNIQFATLPALIEKLTTSPETTDLTKQAESNAFTTVFLTTFRTFTTANRLFDSLTERFNMKIPKSLTDTEEKDWKSNMRDPVRRRILEVFRLWLVIYRLLEEEPHIAQRLTDFLITIGEPHMSTAGKLKQDVERLTFLVPSKVPSSNTPKKSKKSKSHKNDVLKQDPIVIAEQLTVWESSLYMDVTTQECLNHARSQFTKTLHLEKFCSTHDKLGGWVKKSILKHDILPKRADAVDFWIKVAEKCRALNNFASMGAILFALSSTVIQNLHLTWAHVNRKSQLEVLLRYNEPTRSFAGYRDLMKKAQGPCVPFILMYLTELVHVYDQYKQTKQPGDSICFQQMTRWSDIVTNMLKFQSRKYTIAVNEPLAAFIDDQLRDPWDEDWSWARSQEVQQSEMAHADIRKGLEAAGF